MLKKKNCFFSLPIALLLAILIYVILRIKFIDFIPIWDARKYLDCLRKAVYLPFNHQNFDCIMHPSLLSAMLISIPLLTAPDNIIIFNIFTTLFGIIPIIAFYKITRFLFPKNKSFPEQSLLSLLFSFYPIFVANSINFTFDYGLFVFFLLTVYSLLYKKFFLAFISLLFLSFSKETGALLGFLMVFIYIAIFIIGDKKTVKEKLAEFYQLVHLFIPTVIYAIYYFYNNFSFRVHNTGTASLWEFSKVDIHNPLFKSALISIFIINFNWIMTAFILIFFLKLFFSSPSTTKNIAYYKTNIKPRKFIIILFFVSLYICTGYLLFTNTRYFLPVYPLLILVFYTALRDFEQSRKTRILILAILLTLNAVSLFRTIDPISKKLFTTFYFGKHQLLKMTSISGECCGYGRDQLVYNLEFTNFYYIEKKIRNFLNLNPEIPVTHHPYGNHLIACSFDFYVNIRRINNNHICTPRYLSVDEDIIPNDIKPPKIYYIAYPFVDNSQSLGQLQSNYQIVGKKLFGKNGYLYSVYTLELIRS